MIAQLLQGATKKLCGQLWYLSEELVALSFFDRSVDVSEKTAMIEGLRSEGEDHPPKRIQLDQSVIHEKRQGFCNKKHSQVL